MELPDTLVSDVQAGRVVLVLGAGASIGARTPNGEPPLVGLGLRDALSQHFLGGNFSEEPLPWVAELAISETDLRRVQDFIADLFASFEPAEFHRLLPTFKWRGLATTNYDRLIERTYETADEPAQQLVSFISNRDRVDDKLRSPDHVGLLKLHGCITITHDPDLPLILTAYPRRWTSAKRQNSRSLRHPGHCASTAKVRTSLAESDGGRPAFLGVGGCVSCHHSSTRT